MVREQALPAAHTVQLDTLKPKIALNVPLEQGTHEETDDMPVETPNVPAGHSEQFEVDMPMATLHVPAGHGLHVDEFKLVTVLNDPAGHKLYVTMPVALQNAPTGHGTQTVAPVAPL